MLHRSWVLVLAIAGAIAAAGQTVTPAQRGANIEAFEKVWATVRDKHWDPKLGGLDWQAVHDELRPKMEAAKTADEGRVILNDMVGRSKQTHFGIFPESVSAIDRVQGEQLQRQLGERFKEARHDDRGPGISLP